MIQRFLANILRDTWDGFHVVHHEVLQDSPPVFGQTKTPLPEALQKALLKLSIPNLYAHQARALDAIREGGDIIIATPTSSGKSLVYNLAVLESLMAEPEGRALYLFPVKALSRDQQDALEELTGALAKTDPANQFRAAVYDGDTTPYRRTKLRQNHPHILITNPDMLHYALLPFHPKWEAFWKKLRFIVIDEMHTYRGIFGSHVAQVIRRLRRICRHYGSDPRFILLSATIANPEALAGQITGGEGGFRLIEESTAPRAKRHFVFLESEPFSGVSSSTIAARLLVRAAEAGLKTIVFTQSRRNTEVVHMAVQRMAPRLASKVSAYRAGYLPEERRGIEQRLASDNLAGVISTSALELGIDIGGLDLCILVGYPGTVMNTWQRGGRVGRAGQESAILLLPQPDALDQYIVHHPADFLRSQYEIAVTDPYNAEILKAHLPCAASEIPFVEDEVEAAAPAVREVLEELTQTGEIRQSGEGDLWYSAIPSPHRHVDIRSIGASFSILRMTDEGKPIPLGRNDGVRALKECHPGAVYLHRGEPYIVQEMDLERRIVMVEPTHAPYFTRVKSDKDTEILEVLASRPEGNFVIRKGRLRVTENIVGYERRRMFSQELIGDMTPLDLPPQTFETVGFWIEIENALSKHLDRAGLQYMGGIHAVEHALISMFPLFALCDRNDLGGISHPVHPQIGKGAVFVYDGYPGGIGLAARGYQMITPLLRKTLELITSCECEEGCPACIHSPKCGNGNKPLDKHAAVAVLKYLLGDWNLAEEIPGSTEAAEPVPSPETKPEVPMTPSINIGYLDIETQRLADEVGGWNNKHLMRVSVAVLYESASAMFHVYRENDLPRLFEKLGELDLIVGFNIIPFDYEVLKPYAVGGLPRDKTFDILTEVTKHLGHRLSLSHLGEATLGAPKGADGIQAVKWFREGAWEPLIEYCRQDVAITRDLFLHAVEKGYLLYTDRSKRLLRVQTPWKVEELAAGKGRSEGTQAGRGSGAARRPRRT